MRTIQLTRGLETVVDDADYEWLSQFSWSARRGRGNSFYAARGAKIALPNGTFRYSTREMQRDIMDPNRERHREVLVDHRNKNTLDNQRDNLRWSTVSQSNLNRAGWSSGCLKGIFKIYMRSGEIRYGSTTIVNGRRIYGKRQIDPVSAAREYNRLATEFHGEFARLNIIPENVS